MRKSTYAFILLPLLALALLFHDHPALFIVGTIELILIAVVVNAFVIVYSRRNWTANPYGRALMYSKVSLAVLVNLSLIIAFLGPNWEYRPTVRVIAFAGILIAQTRLLQLLFSVRNIAARFQYDLDNQEKK